LRKNRQRMFFPLTGRVWTESGKTLCAGGVELSFDADDEEEELLVRIDADDVLVILTARKLI
jgi:hypothetical protein